MLTASIAVAAHPQSATLCPDLICDGDKDGVAANDWIEGTEIAQTFNGKELRDMVEGKAGNDTLNGDGGSDLPYGGFDNDTLNGGSGSDYLYDRAGKSGGGADTDRINGGSGDDQIYVADGDNSDTVSCGPVNDKVVEKDPGDTLSRDCEGKTATYNAVASQAE